MPVTHRKNIILIRDYNSFDFYTEDCPGTKLSGNGVEVKKENENIVVCSRSQQTLEFEDGKEMYQNLKRNCGAIVFAH